MRWIEHDACRASCLGEVVALLLCDATRNGRVQVRPHTLAPHHPSKIPQHSSPLTRPAFFIAAHCHLRLLSLFNAQDTWVLRSLLGHEWVRSWLGDEACGQFREELVTAILLTLLRLAPIVFLPVGLQVHGPLLKESLTTYRASEPSLPRSLLTLVFLVSTPHPPPR